MPLSLGVSVSIHLSACISLASIEQIFMKSYWNVTKIQNCAKSEKNIRHFTWWPRYVCTVDSNMKYFWHNSSVEGTNSCVVKVTLSSCILLAVACGSAIKGKHIVAFSWQHFQYFYIQWHVVQQYTTCCVPTATVITWTCHNIILYIHCLSC